jgi:sterol desaturase/sphingolipid hydroxylase (fatty acid hydroxylase superfamily)
MNFPIIFYSAVLAVANYPFVMLVDRHVRNRPVRKIFAIEETEEQRQREIRNSWLTTPIHAVLYYAFLSSGVLRAGPESTTLAVASFVLTFLWTEVWHYFSHIAMHWRPLHFIHREHHLSAVTAPWTSVSFSFLEKFIFSLGILGFLALVSRLHFLSAFGIFAYYVLYFYTNTLGHANFEFRKPGYYRRFMGKVFNSPSYHALHHARYVKNYGLLTPWLDWMFGTAWEDVAEVQTMAAEGTPLTRLNQKLQSKS